MRRLAKTRSLCMQSKGFRAIMKGWRRVPDWLSVVKILKFSFINNYLVKLSLGV